MNHSNGTIHSAGLLEYEGYLFIEEAGCLILYDPYGTYMMKLGCKDKEDILAAKRVYIKIINQLLNTTDVLVD